MLPAKVADHDTKAANRFAAGIYIPGYAAPPRAILNTLDVVRSLGLAPALLHNIQMSSKLLYLSAAMSALTSVAHSNMHWDIAPSFQSLSLPASICALDAWWQVGGYFLLNGDLSNYYLN